MTQSCEVLTGIGLKKRLLVGAIGGIAGGIAYAIFMQQMNMFPVLAQQMGMSSAVEGMMIHAMISIIFGMGLGLLLNKMPSCLGKSIMFAALYGVFLWVIGPMMVMPMMMAQPLFHWTPMSHAALIWHIIFAIVALLIMRIILLLSGNKQ
ncbi:hypothetical protein HPC38_08390 [Pasteurellaceae bacterium HPA106]|uniref:hypothetical protein n=1 Tax=Spirabiliibacterium pneumoniae TaxID=221400 RepID=UPI001AACF916|nr:hypothetical protein [Spirabiliibacterium pneumoniae]MBE2896889.1 hypothetical protein [Spirabiliibacterium pneumoniae]